jgi:hypothetical protein
VENDGKAIWLTEDQIERLAEKPREVTPLSASAGR